MKTSPNTPILPQNSADIDGAQDASQVTILDAGAAATVEVPAGFDLMWAKFLRQGPDLLLQAPAGEQVLLVDYFATETPAALTTAAGGRLSGG